MKRKILWMVTIMPLLITVVAIRYMDNRVPLHYEIDGTIDRYGSKYEELLLPIVIIGMTLFWECLIGYYRRKQGRVTREKEVQEAKSNENVLTYVAIGSAIMFSVMQYAILCSAFVESRNHMSTSAIDIALVVNIVMGIFMAVIGNIMPKARLNGTFGVRTPWSMANERTWTQSNRMGGKVMVVSGILIVIESIMCDGMTGTYLMLGIIVASTIILTVYSYRVYQRDRKENMH